VKNVLNFPAHLWSSTAASGRAYLAWVRTLNKEFGWRFLLTIVFGEHFIRGFLDGHGSSGHGFLVIEGLAYMHLRVGAAAKNLLSAVSGSTWALKPVFGLISDVVVLNGYQRSPWIILTSVIGVVALALVAWLGPHLGPSVLCLCFFLIRMQNTWTDSMVQASYTERMQSHPQYAPDIVSWVWGGIAVFTILGVLVVGPGVAWLGPFRIAAFGIPAAAAILIPACLGWLGERKRSDIRWGVDWSIVRRQWRLFACNLLLSLAVLTTSLTAMLHLPFAHQALVALGGGAVTLVATYCLLPIELWKPLLQLFLLSLFTINTYGFADNFFLDAATPAQSVITGYPVCVNAPHFSNTFYVTVLGIWDAFFVLLGSGLFNGFMADFTYRRAFLITQVMWGAAYLLDAVIFERWNLAVGISDPAFTLFKHAVQNTVGMLAFIPHTILISKLCPPGLESTVFALLAGLSNYGNTIASYIGSYVLQVIGLGEIGKGGVDVFRHTWVAVVIHACGPLLPLLLLPLLLPDAKMTDVLKLPPLGDEPGPKDPAEVPDPEGPFKPTDRAAP